MQIPLFTCSEVSLLEARTNTISIINILEDINVIIFPAVIPRLSVSSIIRREENEADSVRSTVKVSLGDAVLFEQNFDLEFHGRSVVRNIIELQGLVIPGPGKLKFSLNVLVGANVAEWVIQVSNIGQAQGVAMGA